MNERLDAVGTINAPPNTHRIVSSYMEVHSCPKSRSRGVLGGAGIFTWRIRIVIGVGMRTQWCAEDYARDRLLPDDAATLDHLYSRLNPLRGKVAGECTVLACWKCNYQRAQQELAEKFPDKFPVKPPEKSLPMPKKKRRKRTWVQRLVERARRERTKRLELARAASAAATSTVE